MASFTIVPLTDHTAAEVIGLDFTEPVDAETRATLNQAFIRHHVLVMRGQHFNPPEADLQPQYKSDNTRQQRTTNHREHVECAVNVAGPPIHLCSRVEHR